MSFSLPRFLRRVQPSDLQRYFSALAILFSEPIEWTAKSSALVESVKTAIETLPERERERVFEDFERVEQLSDEIGQCALQSLIEHNETFNVELRAPNGSNLRDRTWRHQIVEKYLARWGLIKKAMAAVA
jgi:hypothetical protein